MFYFDLPENIIKPSLSSVKLIKLTIFFQMSTFGTLGRNQLRLIDYMQLNDEGSAMNIFSNSESGEPLLYPTSLFE